MNPFEPYLPAYREGTIPERPWWRREGSWCVRTDGACRRGNVGPPPTAYAAMCEGPWFPTREEWRAAIDAYDLAHPLPVPRVLAGQVWADENGCCHAVTYMSPTPPTHIGHSPVARCCLVWGPLAPWAPPGWKP